MARWFPLARTSQRNFNLHGILIFGF